LGPSESHEKGGGSAWKMKTHESLSGKEKAALTEWEKDDGVPNAVVTGRKDSLELGALYPSQSDWEGKEGGFRDRKGT